MGLGYESCFIGIGWVGVVDDELGIVICLWWEVDVYD